jgi:hypothetical protein
LSHALAAENLLEVHGFQYDFPIRPVGGYLGCDLSRDAEEYLRGIAS